ncbi:CatB-related O-acetyltransferase [Thalassococcus sp. CAU 1522]|uniref:CatB-related O-acetyltransferase n=1 Tax=Thalassococcus arenae TaxID=2851652 RepID=A0ABS6N741_9RHOB|nr:CatB-related O-acetyltransferase [Thalassococcus arenae]MBV2359819.1 CatB-related O-acetyltransferase [Thalassococcus arenae]
MPFPQPDEMHPVQLVGGGRHKGTVFLKAVLNHPRIAVGDYTYMSAHDDLCDPDQIAARLAPYLFAFSPERLVIGKFCQIADGVRIITASANHRRDGLSTFPFAIFDGGAADGRPSMPAPGPDTIIGNDVWLGAGATVMPGARIGDGVIVAAGAVVTGSAAPYTVIGGNPAQVIRRRLPATAAARMQALAWWDWPIDHILEHEALICGTDLDALEAAAPRRA